MAEGVRTVKRFEWCPVCGSTERYAESLANEVKARGWMDRDLEFFYESVMKVVEQPDKSEGMPIGSKLPIMFVHEDICLGCGCRYAVKLERGDVMKTLLPAQGGPGGPLSGGFQNPPRGTV